MVKIAFEVCSFFCWGIHFSLCVPHSLMIKDPYSIRTCSLFVPFFVKPPMLIFISYFTIRILYFHLYGGKQFIDLGSEGLLEDDGKDSK